MSTSTRLISSRRQQWRWAILLTSLLLFPVTLNYFSPYLVIDGAAQGIVSGIRYSSSPLNSSAG